MGLTRLASQYTTQGLNGLTGHFDNQAPGGLVGDGSPETLLPEIAGSYEGKGTGAKYLINPGLYLTCSR